LLKFNDITLLQGPN